MQISSLERLLKCGVVFQNSSISFSGRIFIPLNRLDLFQMNPGVPVMPESTATPPKKYRYVFTPREDAVLEGCVETIGTSDWDLVAKNIPGRTARQCRERWTTYLSPDVNRTPWTPEEDGLLFDLMETHGTKWGTIVPYFKNRTQNNVKNRWNTVIRKAKALKLDPSNRNQFIETGKKIASRSTRATFCPKETPPESENMYDLLSVSHLLNKRESK